MKAAAVVVVGGVGGGGSQTDADILSSTCLFFPLVAPFPLTPDAPPHHHHEAGLSTSRSPDRPGRAVAPPTVAPFPRRSSSMSHNRFNHTGRITFPKLPDLHYIVQNIHILPPRPHKFAGIAPWSRVFEILLSRNKRKGIQRGFLFFFEIYSGAFHQGRKRRRGRLEKFFTKHIIWVFRRTCQTAVSKLKARPFPPCRRKASAFGFPVREKKIGISVSKSCQAAPRKTNINANKRRKAVWKPHLPRGSHAARSKWREWLARRRRRRRRRNVTTSSPCSLHRSRPMSARAPHGRLGESAALIHFHY